jgi:hypothetical protein
MFGVFVVMLFIAGALGGCVSMLRVPERDCLLDLVPARLKSPAAARRRQ